MNRRGPGDRSGYQRLTRSDLRGFDAHATALILEAMAANCLGKITRRGHCLLRNPQGKTTTIAPNMTASNRTHQNTRAAIRRLLSPPHAPHDDPPERSHP